MKKFPKIKRLGDSANDGILEGGFISIQEKLDGANFRFTLERNIEDEYHTDDRELVFGSRNVVYKNEKDVDSAFEHAVEYVRETIDPSEVEALEAVYGELVFYGEAMHPHTLDYNWDEVPSFIGFDVFSEESGWIPTPTASTLFSVIDLPTAPIIQQKNAADIDPDELEVPESAYRDGVAEGYVIKNFTTGQRAKVRSEEFKEMHESARQGKTPEEYEPNDATVLAHKFATEARIKKHIHKMRDRGADVQMSMMETLWRKVFDDIIEEEYEEIFLSNYTIDTKEFRSEVASITANVLDTYLSRPNDSVLNEP